MDIYNHNGNSYFTTPYDAKRLLHDSVTKTDDALDSIQKGEVCCGLAHFLLARIEAIAALALSGVVAIRFAGCALILTPCFLIPMAALNILSRSPGLSSSCSDFNRWSSDIIYRSVRVYLIAIPTFFLFFTASLVSAFCPRVLAAENCFFAAIHDLVWPLGPLENREAVVPGVGSVRGTTRELSLLETMEESLRALSIRNYIADEIVPFYTYHYSYTIHR